MGEKYYLADVGDIFCCWVVDDYIRDFQIKITDKSSSSQTVFYNIVDISKHPFIDSTLIRLKEDDLASFLLRYHAKKLFEKENLD